MVVVALGSVGPVFLRILLARLGRQISPPKPRGSHDLGISIEAPNRVQGLGFRVLGIKEVGFRKPTLPPLFL